MSIELKLFIIYHVIFILCVCITYIKSIYDGYKACLRKEITDISVGELSKMGINYNTLLIDWTFICLVFYFWPASLLLFIGYKSILTADRLITKFLKRRLTQYKKIKGVE